MNVNYYLEFFIESLSKFFKEKYNKESLYLSKEALDNKLALRSFYNNDLYNLSVKEILDFLKIPYICTETEEDKDLNLNFFQEYLDKNINLYKASKEINYNLIIKEQERSVDFSNVVRKSKDGIDYMLGINKKELPFIVAYNAYNVSVDIWKNLYSELSNEFNFIIFTGNYGNFLNTPSKINSILMKELENKKAIALTWCSGFKVFAQFNKRYPGRFTNVYAITGNYAMVNGEGILSDFEKSTLALTSLMDDSDNTNVGRIFLFFLSKQLKNPFGIPVEACNMISTELSDNKKFANYIKSIKELSEYDLGDDLKGIDFPMTNIIASNDIVSMLYNNELVNKNVKGCMNIMLNFATHWCIWTHADQIKEIIKR